MAWEMEVFERGFSCDENGNVISFTGKTLKSQLGINGYLSVGVDVRPRFNKRISVHRLVYSYYRGEIPQGKVINHIDGNKANNSISNLECVTYSQNIVHALKIGLLNTKGVDCHLSRFSEHEVFAIRKLLMEGIMQKDIAKLYGVSKNAISKISLGKTWKHLEAQGE